MIEFSCLRRISVIKFLSGSNLLLLKEVRETAGEVLGQLIDHNNVLHIKSLAGTFSCREVESKAHNFLVERFEMVNTTEEFLKLSHGELATYLAMDDIIVKSEESIIDCILRWIDVDPQERSKYFDTLVTNVRFALISDQVLNTRIKSNDRVKSSKVCENLIKEAETLRAKHKRGDGVSQASNAPQYRGSNQLLFLQSANSSTWLNNPPVLFDFKKTKWKAVRGPSGACRYREGTSHVYNEGTIYSLGGEYARDTHHPGAEFGAPGPAFQHLAEYNGVFVGREIVLDNQVYTFTLEDNCWREHSFMLSKRKRHQAVVCNGKIYAIGGTNEMSRTLDSVEMLDLSMGSLEWEEAGAMVSKRVSHGAVVINNTIYVVGGWDGQGVVKSVEMMNPVTGEWSVVSTFPRVRMKSGVAALDGKIYMVGGCLQTLEPCYKAEVFDPITLEWSLLPDSKHARASPILMPYRGKLYVFGGEGNSQGVVECFDPYTNEWSFLDTRIKHHYNGPYTGCLVDKPWNWDMTQGRDVASAPDMQRILSGVGLDVVQTVRSLGVFDN